MTLADYPNDVLTVEEARQVLRLGRNQLYAGIRQGTIPNVRIGKRLLIPKTALARMLEGGEK